LVVTTPHGVSTSKGGEKEVTTCERSWGGREKRNRGGVTISLNTHTAHQEGVVGRGDKGGRGC